MSHNRSKKIKLTDTRSYLPQYPKELLKYVCHVLKQATDLANQRNLSSHMQLMAVNQLIDTETSALCVCHLKMPCVVPYLDVMGTDHIFDEELFLTKLILTIASVHR